MDNEMDSSNNESIDNESQNNTPKQNTKLIYSIFSFLIILFIGSIGLLFYRNNELKKQIDELTVQTDSLVKLEATPTPTSLQLSMTKSGYFGGIYIDSDYGFQVTVQEGWYSWPTKLNNGDILPGTTFTMASYDTQDNNLFNEKGILKESVKNPLKVEVPIMTDDKSTLNELKEDTIEQSRGTCDFKVEEITLDGRPAIQFTNSEINTCSSKMIVSKNDEGYTFRIVFYAQEQNVINDAIFSNIITSFKFLN